MKVALTGATGFVGSHVLTELQEHGHEVTALVRDDAQADLVAARGATPIVGDLDDRPTAGGSHTARPRDEARADLHSALVEAPIDAFAGYGKPYIQIGGLWVYGSNP